MQGQRNTEQKKIILGELACADHPTASQLYEKVRENLEFIPVRYVTDIIDRALLPLVDEVPKKDAYLHSAQTKSHAIRN